MTQSPKLALYTFGLFMNSDEEHPDNDGFWELDEQIFPVVDRSYGLISRSGYMDDEEGPDSWGESALPRFAKERGRETALSTISLWESIEAAMAFAYFGLHSEALKRGREWNIKPQWPPYAAWWWHDETPPTWCESARRHELLHDVGPSTEVFNFKVAFTPNGEPLVVDRTEMKRIVELNASAESKISE